MAEQDNIWFRLGYTLEQARLRGEPAPPRLRSLEERGLARKVEPGQRLSPEDLAEQRELERQLESDLAMELLEEDGEIDGGEEEDEGAPAASAGAAPATGPLGQLSDFLKGTSPTGEPWDAVIAAASAAMIGKMLETMPKQRKLRPGRMVRAAAAGAGAALARELLRPMMSGEQPATTFAERARHAALSGSARGLLYGALVDPRIPGPPLIRGAAYGAIEHLVSPLGGLTALAGPMAPHRRLPFAAELFEGLEHEQQTLMDHIVFGVAMAVLYGARPSDARAEADENEDDED